MPNGLITSKSKLGNYQPLPWGYGGAWSARFTSNRKPPFRLWYVPFMMTDPAISMSMTWVRGRIISQARITVRDYDAPGSDSSVDVGSESGNSNNTVNAQMGIEQTPKQQFIETNLSRFWRNSVDRILMALHWGYSGSEVLYDLRQGMVQFCNTRTISPYDCRPVTKDGRKVGMTVGRVPGAKGRIYLGGMTSFWFVHRPEIQPWFGESKLIGAYEPWHEMYSDGGAKDIRRLYYYKYAFQGDTLYHPIGTTTDDNGQLIPYKHIAQEMVEKRRSGSVLTFPNLRDPITGEREWEWAPGGGSPGNVDILDYYNGLRNEIREGLGVPPEIFTAAETGSGYSGRVIPQEGFDASLQSVVNLLCEYFDEQILQPLLIVNGYGSWIGSYEIIPKNLGDLQSKPTLPGEEGEESTDTPTVNASTHNRNVTVRQTSNSTRTSTAAS